MFAVRGLSRFIIKCWCEKLEFLIVAYLEGSYGGFVSLEVLVPHTDTNIKEKGGLFLP
ncbi:hypothetical protein [Methanothermobacter sp.]|uniref:hypothetical protein n=1 Tax=Methanothermobacter sp. TaxID=1884223 RepID=UPI00261C1525|nr:hypothetical protein [Methanothermobacter sp.]MDI9617766.1 hypothetical protein [Methanothermobacter sp.]